MDLGAEETHAVDVQCLTLGIFLAHEDFAFHAEEGSGRCGSYAVLACAGLGNDSCLAHSLGKECLAKDVIDLVGACG